MEYISIIFRTTLFYFLIIFLFRIMGKREFGELSVIDLIVFIMMGEIISISIEENNESIFLGLVPIGFLTIYQIIFAKISLKSGKFRDFVDGKPSVIIKNGNINIKEMIKQRYNLQDLMVQMRNNNIKSLDEIEYAILETNGSLSIFKYNRFKTPSDFPMPLILDGKIQKDTLIELNKDEKWLERILTKEEVSLENIFYAFLKKQKVYIIKKN